MATGFTTRKSVNGGDCLMVKYDKPGDCNTMGRGASRGTEVVGRGNMFERGRGGSS